MSFVILSVVVPLSRKKAEATLNTTKRVAKVQVAFSITSVVLRTPMIWLEEAKLEAKPPPLDSWMSTTNANNTAVITAKTTSKVYISLIFYICY